MAIRFLFRFLFFSNLMKSKALVFESNLLVESTNEPGQSGGLLALNSNLTMTMVHVWTLLFVNSQGY